MGIQNCKFRFRCTQRWRRLDETDDPAIRYCIECEEEVHWCDTDEDLASAIRSGHCVAIRSRRKGRMMATVGVVI